MTDVEARRAFVLTRRKPGVTFREIGRELGISPSRASQLHAAAVEALERIPPDVYVTSETPLCELPLNWQTRQILAQEPCLTVSQWLCPTGWCRNRRSTAGSGSGQAARAGRLTIGLWLTEPSVSSVM